MPQMNVNCALCDKILQFGMMLGMGARFPKTTANKVGCPPGNRYALCDKILQFGIMLGMGARFSKTTANKVGCPPGNRYAQHSK